jgi:D-3-phosphoglycerate dehydrogenase
MSRPSALGRDKPGGDAICYVAVDEAISDALLDQIHEIPMVKRARRLKF